ncbi:DUF3368 domain-containing protein [Pseudomonadota bacterium]
MSASRIVVSDTTAITYLAQIKAIDLLKRLFTNIFIPQAVYDELTDHGDHIAGAIEVQRLPWIKVKHVKSYDEYTSKFHIELDPGESQAIGLALDIGADLLIIDEVDGRQVAKTQGLNIAGMLGIFIKVKEEGIILAVRPYLNKLRRTNFRLSPVLYNKVLEQAGESPNGNS